MGVSNSAHLSEVLKTSIRGKVPQSQGGRVAKAGPVTPRDEEMIWEEVA